MTSKFNIGDEVVVVVPNREVDQDFMHFMKTRIGKTGVIERIDYDPQPNRRFPDYICIVNLGLGFSREHLFEDWLDFVDKTEVSFDKEQLTSLL